MDIILKEKNREPNLIVFAKQNFTPLQKDIFTLAVNQLEAGVNVQPDLFKNQTVTVSIAMLNSVYEKKYDRLKQECRDLAQRVLEISNDEKEEFKFIVPFPLIQYKKGVIKLTMLAEVAQSFLELKKGYSEYYIRESLSLEQFNKKRLYELFSSFKKRDYPIWTVSDDELKGLLSMEMSDYRGRPAQFERQIIRVCTDSINEITSVFVTYTRKKGINGWETTFTIKDNKKNLKVIDLPTQKKELDEKSLRLISRLEELKVRKDLINQIVENHQSDCWKWLSTNKAEIDSKKFRNPAGVLLVHLGLIEVKTTKAAGKK